MCNFKNHQARMISFKSLTSCHSIQWATGHKDMKEGKAWPEYIGNKSDKILQALRLNEMNITVIRCPEWKHSTTARCCWPIWMIWGRRQQETVVFQCIDYASWAEKYTIYVNQSRIWIIIPKMQCCIISWFRALDHFETECIYRVSNQYF